MFVKMKLPSLQLLSLRFPHERDGRGSGRLRIDLEREFGGDFRQMAGDFGAIDAFLYDAGIFLSF